MTEALTTGFAGVTAAIESQTTVDVSELVSEVARVADAQEASNDQAESVIAQTGAGGAVRNQVVT